MRQFYQLQELVVGLARFLRASVAVAILDLGVDLGDEANCMIYRALGVADARGDGLASEPVLLFEFLAPVAQIPDAEIAPIMVFCECQDPGLFQAPDEEAEFWLVVARRHPIAQLVATDRGDGRVPPEAADDAPVSVTIWVGADGDRVDQL